MPFPRTTLMLRAGLAMLAIGSLLGSGPVLAAPSSPPVPCSASDFPALPVLDCAGWISGNLFQGDAGSVVSSELLSALQTLSSSSPAFNGASFFDAGSTYLQKQDLATLLGPLHGTAVLGLHYGNFPDTPNRIGNASVVLLVNADAGLDLSSLTIPTSGLSNGAVFANGRPPSVPSPGPLALVGLGLAGLGLSRLSRWVQARRSDLANGTALPA